MSSLRDRDWRPKYDSDADLVAEFYWPVLSRAIRYDRTTGFFSAAVLTLAARGIESLVQKKGHMRLLVSCALDEPEVEAIERGLTLREAVERHLARLEPVDAEQADALELLSWMVAKGFLEVKVAVPCTEDRRPITGTAMFHEKAGVIEDSEGDRLAFNGSVNETAAGWLHNWESFHVYRTWAGATDEQHVAAEEESFARLWTDKAKRSIVIDVPSAVRADLLRFLPEDDAPPKRIREIREPTAPYGAPGASPQPPREQPSPGEGQQPLDPRRLVWGFLQHAPGWPDGGELVGEATSAVVPWPHQVHTFHRLFDHWPPRLLIADEVGLGKTISAGLLLRQAMLSGRARRILIMAPKAVLPQWQAELREKFNLNWPIYDGQQLAWYACKGLGHAPEQPVSHQDWHKQPFILTSSQLMRRGDRMRELLEEAEPFDLVVLDEAHHARRRGAGGQGENRPNQLLRLMRQLKDRTTGLVLLTATPMQIDPVEVWDLLDLLGLPSEWTSGAFLAFFEHAAMISPSQVEFEEMARLFRAAEARYGEVSQEEAAGYVGGRRLAAKALLEALRDVAAAPRKALETERRRSAIALMRANTPLRRLMVRHTRDLLRRYYKEGKISVPIATREVHDEFVVMTEPERHLYDQVEDYISDVYNRADPTKRSAVGFVMTVYRKRLASSFAALRETLQRRLDALGGTRRPAVSEEDTPDDELADEQMDVEEASDASREALLVEERTEIASLLDAVRALPLDTKARRLQEQLQGLLEGGYPKVMIFTQYTDTIDFLRGYLTKTAGLRVLCFSGRGGERLGPDGEWHILSREDTKRLFRDGDTQILLTNDAGGEGLNFQFCGALINYDMPWNPMRVEQRIGRIDRLGQEAPVIRIVNMHYRDTVETDVYIALKERIGLFTQFVGRLQPILATLPRQLEQAILTGAARSTEQRKRLVSQLREQVDEAEASPFDLDAATAADFDLPSRPAPLYDLADLDMLLHRPELLPPGVEVRALGHREHQFTMPGMREPLRVTTDPVYFEEHPSSTELWSPGSPLFPTLDNPATEDEMEGHERRLSSWVRPPA